MPSGSKSLLWTAVLLLTAMVWLSVAEESVDQVPTSAPQSSRSSPGDWTPVAVVERREAVDALAHEAETHSAGEVADDPESRAIAYFDEEISRIDDSPEAIAAEASRLHHWNNAQEFKNWYGIPLHSVDPDNFDAVRDAIESYATLIVEAAIERNKAKWRDARRMWVNGQVTHLTSNHMPPRPEGALGRLVTSASALGGGGHLFVFYRGVATEYASAVDKLQQLGAERRALVRQLAGY